MSVHPIKPEHLSRIDLRTRQLQFQAHPKFTHHDALLLIVGAYSAVLFGLVIYWVQS